MNRRALLSWLISTPIAIAFSKATPASTPWRIKLEDIDRTYPGAMARLISDIERCRAEIRAREVFKHLDAGNGCGVIGIDAGGLDDKIAVIIVRGQG